MEKINLDNDTEQLQSAQTTKKSFLSNLSKRQKLSLITLSFFVAIIPLGTSAALLTTRLNSRAYLPATPPTPPVTITITPTPSATPSATPTICVNSVSLFKVQRPCRPQAARDQIRNETDGRFSAGYMYANITCQNGYKELYKSQTCISEANLRTIANQICQRKATCPSPTVSNNAPQFQTNSLPQATVNRPYSGKVTITDKDLQDTVKITTSPLPTNLKLTCKKVITNTNKDNTTECQIIGTPQKGGTFDINFKATDSKGDVTTKTLKLTVQNRPTPSRI